MARLKKVKDVVIYRDEHYNTFPSAVVRQNGEVLVMFRQAPDRTRWMGGHTHIDHASRAACVVSRDGGHTWETKSAVIYEDYVFGVQDPCVNRLADGTLLMTFFTWEVLRRPEGYEYQPGEQNIHDRYIGRLGGVFTMRSEDDGRSWDAPIPVGIGTALRGNAAQLPDGTVLLPVYGQQTGGAKIAASRDLGRTWREWSTIAESERVRFYEPNIFRTKSGKLIAFLRSRKMEEGLSDRERHPLYTSVSHDDGKTWSPVREHRIFSPTPFHVLQLSSGDVLITYGYRNEPFGIRALLLNEECTDIDEAEEIILRDDGHGFDLGYTSAVQLANGQILVTYYYHDDPHGPRYIAGSICELA